MHNPQLSDDGKLKHLLSIEGLPRSILNQILDTAESFVGVAEREVKKVPLLRGKTVCNIFFENSTRTRTTFEIAAKRLSADVINLNVNTSSQSKGETDCQEARWDSHGTGESIDKGGVADLRSPDPDVCEQDDRHCGEQPDDRLAPKRTCQHRVFASTRPIKGDAGRRVARRSAFAIPHLARQRLTPWKP